MHPSNALGVPIHLVYLTSQQKGSECILCQCIEDPFVQNTFDFINVVTPAF